MVITRKIPWKRPESTRPPRRARPLSAQALAGVVVILAALFLYQGTVGRQMLRSLDTYLGGGSTVSTTTTAPVSPQANGNGGVDTLTKLLDNLASQVRQGDWNGATASLSQVEDSWLSLQATFSRAGVKTQDLNAVTADLSELALALAAKNSQDALAQVQATERELDWITTNYLSSSAPTMAQMATVIQDLNQAVAAKDWNRVASDARELSQMMQALQKGF
jgi:hypothetical protein